MPWIVELRKTAAEVYLNLYRLIPLSLATVIAYFPFGIWYRGPDTSPAKHPVSVPVGVAIALAIVLGPALVAFAVARAEEVGATSRRRRWPQKKFALRSSLSLSS